MNSNNISTSEEESSTSILDQLDAFVSEMEDDDAINDESKEIASLDQLLDQMSLATSVHSQNFKRQKTGINPSRDLRPIAFVRFNTRQGKAKPMWIRALLDSGASESIISKKFTSKLKMKKTGKKTTWNTPSGQFATDLKAKAQFTIPELHDNKLIEWDLHVAPDMGAHEMIIGRDILQFLKIDIRFSDMIIEWEGQVMPFKKYDAKIMDAYHIQESPAVDDSIGRIKQILDAKYVPADLNKICSSQSHLSEDERQQLFQSLDAYAHLFDGTLGKWKGTEVNLELKEGSTPYHARPYPIPKCHMETLKMEVDRLCRLGVLRKVNRSEWAAPTFIIPKKDGTVRFISDFRELNKRIRRKPYPIPHIQDMLLNLEGFQYATSLDLNVGYYHVELNPNSRELCTIVLPFGKYEYQRVPMGLCNSPDIFQEKMSELMDGLEFVRTYIDDLLCLTKGSFEDHLTKLEQVFIRLSQAGLKINANKSFFARPELEYLGYWITREGIQPMKSKVEAIMRLAPPKNRKELRSFIGIVNYYRDMWLRRSHILAPLASLTSKTTKWEWGPQQAAAFAMAKKVISDHALKKLLRCLSPYTQGFNGTEMGAMKFAERYILRLPL